MSENSNKAEFKPDYTMECDNCGHTPTVAIYQNGKQVQHTEMCGACTWGEAACLDPDNW